MYQNITKSVKMLVDEANTIVDTISVEEAQNKLDDNNYIFVDIRDFRELKREGKIPRAFSCPRGMLEFWIDPNSPYHKDIFNQNKTYIFYCASAWRSALAGKISIEMGLKPVLHLEGGFSAWKKSNAVIEEVE
jgi:rhodanese-related sulfurtransferase